MLIIHIPLQRAHEIIQALPIQHHDGIALGVADGCGGLRRLGANEEGAFDAGFLPRGGGGGKGVDDGVRGDEEDAGGGGNVAAEDGEVEGGVGEEGGGCGGGAVGGGGAGEGVLVGGAVFGFLGCHGWFSE